MTKGDFDGPRYKRLGQIRRLLEGGALAPDLRWAGVPPAAG